MHTTLKNIICLCALALLVICCNRNADKPKPADKAHTSEGRPPQVAVAEIVEFPFDKSFVTQDAISYLDLYINQALDNKRAPILKHIADEYDVTNPFYAAINAITDDGDSVRVVIVLFPALGAKRNGYAFADWYLTKKMQYERQRVGFTVGPYEEFVNISRKVEISD